MSVVSEILDPIDDFPLWATLIGWLLALLPTVPIFYYLFKPDIEEDQGAREIQLPEVNEEEKMPEDFNKQDSPEGPNMVDIEIDL